MSARRMRDRGRQEMLPLIEKGAHKPEMFDADPSVVALRRFLARLEPSGTGRVDVKVLEARQEAEEELRRIYRTYFDTE